MDLVFLKRLSHNSYLQVLTLALSILICYYGLWNAYFATLDDFLWTGLMRHRATFVEALQGLGNGVRFLNYAMVWTKTKFFDLDASLYFWSSLLQHGIVTFIVFQLVQFWTQRRLVAFLAALLYATKFSHFEIVTSISASDYSFWAIFYITTVALFAFYLQRGILPLYLGSVGAYAVLAFGHDFTLNMPLVLLAYHLILGRGSRKIGPLGWADIKLHIPYWLLWATHVTIQFYYIYTGSSEAVYSEEAYEPGFHMVSNLFYLVFLIVPNVHIDAIQNFLAGHVSLSLIDTIWQLTILLAFLSHMAAAFCFWKGSPLVKFAIAWIYLPFLQYTPWGGEFAGAVRYLYIPSIGYSILLALLLVRLYDYLCQKETFVYRLAIPAIVTMFLIFNIVALQVWVQRHVENGKFRRPFVAQLGHKFQDVEPNSIIYIEVPEEKFIDLEASCALVIRQPVQCQAFVSGQHSMAEVTNQAHADPVYWLQATSDGLSQIYPPVSASP